jgi:uncharacterized membrane protein
MIQLGFGSECQTLLHLRWVITSKKKQLLVTFYIQSFTDVIGSEKHSILSLCIFDAFFKLLWGLTCD